MIIPKQKIYSSYDYQDEISKKYKNFPHIYLTKIINENFLSCFCDNSIILNGLKIVKIEKFQDLYVVFYITPGMIILNKKLIIFNNKIELKIDLTSNTNFIYILINKDYKFIIDNKELEECYTFAKYQYQNYLLELKNVFYIKRYKIIDSYNFNLYFFLNIIYVPPYKNSILEYIIDL